MRLKDEYKVSYESKISRTEVKYIIKEFVPSLLSCLKHYKDLEGLSEEELIEEKDKLDDVLASNLEEMIFHIMKVYLFKEDSKRSNNDWDLGRTY